MKKTFLVLGIVFALAVLWQVSGLREKLHPFAFDKPLDTLSTVERDRGPNDDICDEPYLAGPHHPALKASPPYYGAQLAEMAGFKRQAIGLYTRAIELDPGAAGLYLKRGNLYCVTGNRFEALSDYSRAIGRDPRYAKAYYNRGVTNLALSDFYRDEAIADIKTAADLGLSDAKIWKIAHGY